MYRLTAQGSKAYQDAVAKAGEGASRREAFLFATLDAALEELLREDDFVAEVASTIQQQGHMGAERQEILRFALSLEDRGLLRHVGRSTGSMSDSGMYGSLRQEGKGRGWGNGADRF